jgi:ABC-type lipoprotein export system ATPase subunit
VIELRGISKHYPQGLQKTWVLRHVDLTVRRGEFVTVMGPSGSGKSTLLHLLGLLDEPSGGEYYFDGVPVHTLSERQRTALHRERIGFVFQAYHLLDDLTVYENLETPLLYQKLPTAERKARVAEMLDRFGMVAKAGLFPSQLSGGQQQLVGVARALIIQPSLILADEPTGNLHSGQGEQVMETFRALNEHDGVTIIQVTHSEKFAGYGRRTVELLDGKVVSAEAVTSSVA